MSTTTTGVLVDQFLAAKIAKGLSVRTIEVYRQRLTRFTLWLGDRPIVRPVLRGYIAEMQREHLSPVTVAAYFRDVSVFCSWLVEEGELSANPAAKLAPRVPKRRPASYTPAQIKQLLAVCDPRDRAIIIMLLDTGLRASELCSLDRTSIDPNGHFSVIGKGNKERTGRLSIYAWHVLQAYLATRTDDDPALWIGVWRGQRARLKPNGLYQRIARRAEQAGLRGDVRRLVHAFRASFAKFYLKQGGDLESLRRLLGHESIVMAAHYAQLADDELLDRKDQVDPLRAALE